MLNSTAFLFPEQLGQLEIWKFSACNKRVFHTAPLLAGRHDATYRTAIRVVVSHEGIEGSELRPPDTQLSRRSAHKSADISAHERYAEKLKIQDSYKRE